MDNAECIDYVRTGPGTLAGRYLRMFWQPVYRAEDLAPGQAVPIRIMSEDFTLYRGEGGTPHVVDFRCAHRGTQLSTGWVEGDCIRCRYHGWKYDGYGQCVEQPGEDKSFASKAKIKSYPTKEYLGLIFAYLGAGEQPSLRRYRQFEDGTLEVGPPEVWPCNYFNRLDNACDSFHIAFAHRESALRANRPERLGNRKTTAEETEYGTKTSSVLPGRPPNTIHFHMPNTNQVRPSLRSHASPKNNAAVIAERLFWRVPIDDEHCVSFVVTLVPGDMSSQSRPLEIISPSERAEAIIAGKLQIEGLDHRTDFYSLFWVEDYVVQVGQGFIADRSNERLGRTDVGVILLRKIWERELRALAEGRPLKQWTTPACLGDMRGQPGITEA